MSQVAEGSWVGSVLEFTLSILRLGKQSFDIILSRLSVIACRSPDINPTLENMSYKKRNEIKLFQSTPSPSPPIVAAGFFTCTDAWDLFK
jgi:hypothetical protein